MSWTVPNGCYFGCYDCVVTPHVWRYYDAGDSVPNTYAPNASTLYPFVLVDFTNGYVYSAILSATNVTISGNTFTASSTLTWSPSNTAIAVLRASYEASGVALSGDPFTFGDGSGILNKTDFLENSTTKYYSLNGSFKNRTDITSVTLPTGAQYFESTFSGCTNLQTVSGTIVDITTGAFMFENCSSLTSVPTFQSVGVPLRETSWTYKFYKAFCGCSSLATAPTLPSGITDVRYCFYGCTALTTAPTIPSSVTQMSYCFSGCSALTTAPTIPSGVTDLQFCFNGCSALTSAPTIPSGVTSLRATFQLCTSLATAPSIPSSVTNFRYCFYGCSALVGAITIDASPDDITSCFENTVNDIVLFGSGSLEDIASGYNNVYIWSLSTTMTAVRDSVTQTTINISVDVTRFDTGTLTALELYKDNGVNPLTVTWNDPTLDVSAIPTTFTTSVTNISDSDTPTFTIIATDTYGSSAAVSVKVPISFYTMDVQAGGKEIAFGALADDDITNTDGKDFSTDGLFKCRMGTSFNDMSAQEVTDFVNNLNVGGGGVAVDLVVEQGTSGGWYYRKWNSGLIEADIVIPSPTWGTAGTINGVIRQQMTLPTPPTMITYLGIYSSGVNSGCWTASGFDGNMNPLVYVYRISGAVQPIHVTVHLRGTWK